MSKYGDNDDIFVNELAKRHKLKIDMTYNEYLIVNIINKLKINQIYPYSNNAELIKNLFQLNYETWTKDTFELSEKITLWMIYINKEERKNSYYFEDGYLVEYFHSDLNKKIKPIRVLFQIDDDDLNKIYIYRGLYTLDDSRTTTEKKYYKPIELED